MGSVLRVAVFIFLIHIVSMLRVSVLVLHPIQNALLKNSHSELVFLNVSGED